MRLFTYPRPTVAAVNGHAFAGGLITAAVCDHRIAVDDEAARFGIDEVPIGIPMPAVYIRMLQYAFTKRACQPAARRDIADLTDPLDRQLPDGMTSADARHAHRRYWRQLKKTDAPW